MSTPFQNRLVGSIIVAAAVIIFLPDILDGDKKSYQADFEAIPEAPAFKSKNTDVKSFPEQKLKKIPKQSVSDEQALDDNQSGAIVVEETIENTGNTQVNVLSKAPEAVVKPNALPEKSVLGEAWVIHLGSFKHKKNVDELLKKLKDNGYTAYTSPIKTKNGTLTKVIVGPELIKSEMVKKIPSLKALTKVQGKIAKYKPTK